ncbi:3-carboxy-cis,cis-muconate cycloisomerase [Micromonospora pattaloongensis]|uniref:3-carboxy-cis,cis-muconate cycloisomerase n=1 Tax=Micromonospora pattaloongensis TaxID=405436 RepID=A0A1H3KM21_9ACTN|nr:3-carboxy-cis,cis-muconate cycloisomerase [Micromonospora pattaloongensis]SDY53223.1 3-carboxy-cis,cis-muconate cycloisomerase [Micromonospora pattaloongensis]
MSEPPPTTATAGGLFDGVLAAGPVRAAVDDRAWLQALLDVEAALARAQAAAGMIPAGSAATIADACRAERFDVARLGTDAAAGGNPVIPLVRALRAAVDPDTARHVHAGATSQDIMDSAAMLVARRALAALTPDLVAAADAAARLAAAHRDTPMAARTLLQQALPTTFGLVAAGWLTALDDAVDRLDRIRDERLAVQLGGAAGTLAALDGHGPTVVGLLAAELGLAEPTLPWHTDRSRIAELAGALGAAAGTLGKIARDVTLLAQTEVGELVEGRPGGSSTLPHKRNPVAAVAAVAAATQAPGLVATLLGAMIQEHQRAAGAWHAEWRPLRALFESVGSAAHWLRVCLTQVRVDADRMRSNLDATGGALLAERVSGALAGTIGRGSANELVAAAVARAAEQAAPLAAQLAAEPRIAAALSRQQIESLLEPAGYLGSAPALTDRALARHASRTEGAQ